MARSIHREGSTVVWFVPGLTLPVSVPADDVVYLERVVRACSKKLDGFTRFLFDPVNGADLSTCPNNSVLNKVVGYRSQLVLLFGDHRGICPVCLRLLFPSLLFALQCLLHLRF